MWTRLTESAQRLLKDPGAMCVTGLRKQTKGFDKITEIQDLLLAFLLMKTVRRI